MKAAGTESRGPASVVIIVAVSNVGAASRCKFGKPFVEITLEMHVKEHGMDITRTYVDVTIEDDAASTYDDSSVIGGLSMVVHNSASRPYFKVTHVNAATESITEGSRGWLVSFDGRESIVSSITQYHAPCLRRCLLNLLLCYCCLLF